MKTILGLAFVVLAVNALSDQDQWVAFKANHGKTYTNHIEEKFRYGLFRENLRKIEKHNTKYENGEVTWFMKANQFSDRTQEEIDNMFALQKKIKPSISTNFTYYKHPENLEIPSSIDWRAMNAVREVKAQLNCGSCWSFSTTGVIEGQFALKRNIFTSLSEQDLIDCSMSYGANNCVDGGWVSAGLEYVRDHGIMAESDYPYEAQISNCRSDPNRVVGRVGNQVYIPEHDENGLLQACGNIGPISVAVFAPQFVNYGGGIFDSNDCPNTSQEINHAVLAVGYGNENGVDYWIVKNSWGPQWGDQGYIRMRRGKNLCGIAIEMSYPEV